MKKCTTCKEIKYDNEFSKYSASKGGLQAKCKDCARVYQKEYRKENRKRLTEYHNEWHKKDITQTLIIE